MIQGNRYKAFDDRLSLGRQEHRNGLLLHTRTFGYGFCIVLLMVLMVFAAALPARVAFGEETTTSSTRKAGWHKVKSGSKTEYYYVLKSGEKAKGWQKIGENTYYFAKKTGYRVTGLKRIAKKRYLFDDKGVVLTGWQTIKGRVFFFSRKQLYALTGLCKIGTGRYYFSSKGIMQHGWQVINGKTYYFGSNGQAYTGLQYINGTGYYFTRKGVMRTGLVRIGADTYYFKKNGEMLISGFTPGGRYAYRDGKILKTASLKSLLKAALLPVGTTLYCLGGAWGEDAWGSGSALEARTIGVSARWKEFFNMYGSEYNSSYHRYETHNGLDCSGYVGWTLYNTFNTASGNAGFVMLAEHMASSYSSYGWGSYTAAGTFSDFRPGDIMSLASGHVYIVVGQCSDGSVVLLHSSPPGVMITGTYTPSGSKFSQATALSSKYMKKYYPEYYNKFSSKLSRGTSYLTGYARMRWYITGNKLMTDPDNFASKNASQVLRKILGKA